MKKEINKEKNFASAIIYVHNNERLIRKFCETLYRILDTNFNRYEIIFVNDNCTDKTINIIKDFFHQNRSVATSIINMNIYHGIELAMNSGIDLAIGDFVFEFDYVLIDYNEQKIIDAYTRALNGFDIVSVSPIDNIPFTSKLFYSLFNYISKAKYSIRTDRFRILSRRSINITQSLSKIISYRKAIYVNSGLKIDSLFYEKIANSNDNRIKQNIDFSTKRKIALDTLITFTDIASRISIYFTVLLLLFSLLVGIYTILIYIHKKPIEGWTTIMLLTSISFSGIFIVLSVIIKYLSLIMSLVSKKQKYLIESVEKL